MSRRSLLLAIGTVALLVLASGSCLAMLVRHEPSFFRRGTIPPGPLRKDLSEQCEQQFTRILEGFINKGQWESQFSEDQLNSYFEEGLTKKHNVQLPENISEPRVAFEKEKVRLAFRYGIGIWSCVISIDVHPWLVAKDPNVVALEFESLHAGAIPISAQWLREEVDGFARLHDIEATWYRRHGHPVVLLRFQASRIDPTFQFLELQARPGILSVTGHSLTTG
jgi:hypothetical protein